MFISVDGGALCTDKAKQYGTYRFTTDLLRALFLYDAKNDYIVYTYCDIDKSQTFDSFSYKDIRPRLGWMKLQITREEVLHRKNIFLAVNQALPLYTPARKVVICHGLSFYKYPDCYKDQYHRLMNQLRVYARYADDIIVSSTRVKDDLKTLPFPVRGRIHVQPFGIPFPFQTYEKQKREPFFLYVGSDQKIKNLPFLVRAFEKFSSFKGNEQVRLLLIGVNQINSKNRRIQCIPHLPSEELKSYYQRALGYLTTSRYESLNYPVIEAVSQRCPVVALEQSIIPEQQQFVNTAHNEQDFVDKMHCSAFQNNKNIYINKFEQTFSWKKFVNNLTRIYNE